VAGHEDCSFPAHDKDFGPGTVTYRPVVTARRKWRTVETPSVRGQTGPGETERSRPGAARVCEQKAASALPT